MNEAKINPNVLGSTNDVPRTLQIALSLVKAAESAGTELRRQHQLIQQLKGENQHLRDINHNLAEQLCQKTQDTAPAAPEEQKECAISIVADGDVPPEVRNFLMALTALLNVI